jgi:surfactin synthase thioesterase subunit
MSSSARHRTAWFSAPQVSPYSDGTAAQFYVFPHAGGSALTYRAWAATLPSTLEFRALQLPGRQERLHETPADRLAPLLAELLNRFEAELDGRPYVLFGHSFGALLAYRLTVEIERAGVPGPDLVAISGWGPGLASDAELGDVPGMDNRRLLAKIADLGLMPENAATDPAVLAAVLPSLRADLTVARDYVDDGAVVDAPLVVYAGTDDPIIGGDDLSVWRHRSRAFLGVNRYPGGHFYLFEHAAAVQADIEHQLRRK